jgi:hypothetical protein
MRYLKALLLAASAVLLTSCAGVVSLHSVAATHLTEPNLEGQWREVKANEKGEFVEYTVTRVPDGYKLTVAGEKGEATARLLKAGDHYLMEVRCPSDSPSPRVNVYFRVRIQGNSAWSSEMQSDWLREQIQSSGKLRYEIVRDGEGDGQIVLTASPDELRRYLLPYAADARAFDKEGTEVRRISGEPRK